MIETLRREGLVKEDKSGNLSPTPRLARLFGGLHVSLDQLTAYTEEALVSQPVFGPPRIPSRKADVFVLMPFADALKSVYEDHISRVAQKLGVTFARADDFFGADSIISDIWGAINAARIMIADCSGRNPNVFYEIGLAHSIGKPVILISQTKEDVPFDVQQFRTIFYEFTSRGMVAFETKLETALGYEMMLARNLEEYLADSPVSEYQLFKTHESWNSLNDIPQAPDPLGSGKEVQRVIDGALSGFRWTAQGQGSRVNDDGSWMIFQLFNDPVITINVRSQPGRRGGDALLIIQGLARRSGWALIDSASRKRLI